MARLPAALLALALAAPAAAQLRAPAPYDGTAPGHPPDEPGPALGQTAADALALFRRGDLDAARLAAGRCLRRDREDAEAHACRLIGQAVEAGLDGTVLPPEDPAADARDLRLAEARWRSGAALYYGGEPETARAEWAGCRRLDRGHPLCALGLRLLASGGAPPRETTSARQLYMSGVLHWQAGDAAAAARAWKRCAKLAPDSDTAQDCRDGLEFLRSKAGSRN